MKFAWPTFWAALVAMIVVSIVTTLLFKKFVNKTTGEVEAKFTGGLEGAKGLTGYRGIQY